MIPKRVPIRSPIQLPDLKKPAPETPKEVPVDAFVQIGKLIDELTQLRDQWEKDHEAGVFKGEKGDPGEKGESIMSPEDLMPYVEYMLHMVKSELPVVKDGRDGIDGKTPVRGVDYHTESDKQEIIEHVVQRIPKPKDGVSPTVDHEQLASVVIGRILDGKLLKKGHIDGLEQEIASYRSQFANGKGYVHGGGDTIVAGSGVTVTPNANGTKTISASGGGFSTLSATETPNGNLTVFTFAGATAQPSFIISDNVFMRAVAKNGTVNWTWNSGLKQATMTIPPSEDILGIV